MVLGNTGAHGSILTSNATGKGDISFASTIDADGIGTQYLTVSAADNALFGDNSDTGSIGFNNALAILTVTANTNSTGLGKIRLNSEVVNTNSVLFGAGSGNQFFNSAVVLGNTVGSTLTSTGLGTIDFASTIDAAALGTQTLTVNAAEDAIFDGNIGAISPGTALGALTVTAGGKINLNSAIVKTNKAGAGTTGNQLFLSLIHISEPTRPY